VHLFSARLLGRSCARSIDQQRIDAVVTARTRFEQAGETSRHRIRELVTGIEHVDTCSALHKAHHSGRLDITTPLFLSFVSMRVSTLSRACVTLVLAALAAAENASDVIELNAASFDAALKAEPLMLVEFFAPWWVQLHKHYHLRG
jgi:hypothetical protein